MKPLVSIEERKAYWRYETFRKQAKKMLGEDWFSIMLDEGSEELKQYLLRMHQIALRLWMEKHPRTNKPE